MNLMIWAPKQRLESRTGVAGMDIVVPFTTRQLTREALAAAGRMSAGLRPLIRMVRTQVVPFPLQLDASPVSVEVLREQLSPLAKEFGAHLQICYARDNWEGLLHLLNENTVVVIASRHKWFWRTREERFAAWLIRRGYNVLVQYIKPSSTVDQEKIQCLTSSI